MVADGGGADQAVGCAQLSTHLTSQVTADSTCRSLAQPVSHTDHAFPAFLLYARPSLYPQDSVFHHPG